MCRLGSALALWIGVLSGAAAAPLDDLERQFDDALNRAAVDDDASALPVLDALEPALTQAGRMGCPRSLRWAQALALHGQFAAAAQRAAPCDADWPRITPPQAGQNLLRFQAAASAWQALDWRRFTGVLVQSSPFCGFSERATRDLLQDPQLNGWMSRHALWLGRDFTPGPYADWNRRNAPQRLLFVADPSGFPFRQPWTTPIFYAVRDGQVLARKVGWHRDDDNLGELRRLLALVKDQSVDMPPASRPLR